MNENPNSEQPREEVTPDPVDPIDAMNITSRLRRIEEELRTDFRGYARLACGELAEVIASLQYQRSKFSQPDPVPSPRSEEDTRTAEETQDPPRPAAETAQVGETQAPAHAG